MNTNNEPSLQRQILTTDTSKEAGRMIEEYANHKWYQGFYSGLQVGMISVTIYYLVLGHYYR